VESSSSGLLGSGNIETSENGLVDSYENDYTAIIDRIKGANQIVVR